MFDIALQRKFFIDFSFFKPDGVERRQDDPSRYQVLNWSRNRITHYRDDLPNNTPPPWPRGIQIQGRGPNGIRTFVMSGRTSVGVDKPIIAERTDRRMFTKLVQYFADEYINILEAAGIDTSESETIVHAMTVEHGA
jgi:hypothetical protein